MWCEQFFLYHVSNDGDKEAGVVVNGVLYYGWIDIASILLKNIFSTLLNSAMDSPFFQERVIVLCSIDSHI